MRHHRSSSGYIEVYGEDRVRIVACTEVVVISSVVCWLHGNWIESLTGNGSPDGDVGIVTSLRDFGPQPRGTDAA